MRCPRCKGLIPDEKFCCPRCVEQASHEAFLDHQRHYIALISADRVDLMLVYTAENKKVLRPAAWHLKRLGDDKHGYCGDELPPGARKTVRRYSSLHEQPFFCPRCKEVLAELIAEIPSPKHDAVLVNGETASFI